MDDAQTQTENKIQDRQAPEGGARNSTSLAHVMCLNANPFAIPIYLFSIAKKHCCLEFFSKDKRRMFQRFSKSSGCFSSIRILFKNRKQHAFAAQTPYDRFDGRKYELVRRPASSRAFFFSRESQHWIFAGLRIQSQTRFEYKTLTLK